MLLATSDVGAGAGGWRGAAVSHGGGAPSLANTNNGFTVGLGATGPDAGAFKSFTSAATQVIVDLTGYYAPPGAGGLFYHPLPAPVRLLEMRPGQIGCFNNQGQPLQGTGNPDAGPALDLPVQGRGPGLPAACNSIPGDAVLLIGNATTVLPTGPGYLTIYPSDVPRPTIASSNYAHNRSGVPVRYPRQRARCAAM